MTSDEHKEFVKVDFAYYNPKFQYFKDGNLLKKWEVKKKDAEDMIFSLIEAHSEDKFKANRIKNALNLITQTFDPKTIKIVKKEHHE